jgi:hypothetical protein
MARIVVARQIPAPARVTWNLVTDWPSHGRWVPLTTVRVLTSADGVGTRFVGRTGLGPFGFDDPMQVSEFVPPTGDLPGDGPGRCTVVKQGRVVTGSAWFEVRPLAGGICLLTWGEDVEIRPRAVTSRLQPLVAFAARLGLRAGRRPCLIR